MTDILYIVRPSDWGDCEELRYALRSLELHAKNLGRVFVCGYLPVWCKGVVHIKCDNRFDRKAKNTMHRLRYAVTHSDLERFAISSDDIYLNKDIDLDHLPLYWKNGAEVSVPDGMQNTRISHIIADARQFLIDNGYGVRDYGGGHCLHLCTKAIFERLQPLFDKAMATTYGVPFDLLIGAELKRTMPAKKRTDRKGAAEYHRQCDYFSSGEDVQTDGTAELLARLYPNKSRFEK